MVWDRNVSYESRVRSTQKRFGAYYTPEDVARSLVAWLAPAPTDRLLDPSCGDGRFLAAHPFSVGVEQNPQSAALAREQAPSSLVHVGDFFSWAFETDERFECAAGNPPFIRYQTFAGDIRKRAQRLCSELGVEFSGLASSWAPFLVATANLLRPGGRLAFVVPAEIGHAPYAAPLLEYLISRFSRVHVVAIREKLFPELSEDCWLLFADGAGGSTQSISFSATERFELSSVPPEVTCCIPVQEWRAAWNRRLRPYLLPARTRSVYQRALGLPGSVRLGDIASVGIGYVSGANGFFHLRPSQATTFQIPDSLLQPTVRNGRGLPRDSLTSGVVAAWREADRPMLLLRLPKSIELPTSVKAYLESEAGNEARQAFKCRSRSPWWSVPDVVVPDLMLTYMSGERPNLVRNAAGCACTNSLHAVRMKPGRNPFFAMKAFSSPLAQLSCELEGHPLGGGMLKLEPREAGRIVLSLDTSIAPEEEVLTGVATLRRWRHSSGEAAH